MATADRPDAAQYRQDQRLLEALASQPLSNDGLTICCRLIMRYENTGPGSQELAQLAQNRLEAWGLNRREAFLRARKLWNAGFRPTLNEAGMVGSGADVDG